MFRPLDWLLGLFSLDIGIDLGTANTLVAIRDRGIVINEPSWVAINKRTRRPLAIGSEAREMVGRTPSDIVAIRPLRDGVISEFEITEAMLKYFIDKAHDDDKPFFIWHNPTRMHVFTHLSPHYESLRNPENEWTIQEAGMKQFDDIVGSVMEKLDDLGVVTSEQLARARLGHRDLLEPQVVLAVVDDGLHVDLGRPGALATKEALEHEGHVLLALPQPAVEVGEPVGPVGDVDAHTEAGGDQGQGGEQENYLGDGQHTKRDPADLQRMRESQVGCKELCRCCQHAYTQCYTGPDQV